MSSGLFPDFEGPAIMNAAGTVKTVEQARQLSDAPVPAVVVGSFTVEERCGNEGRTFFDSPMGALNSMGLPGPGIAVWTQWVEEMASALHDKGKQLWVSVAGFNPPEYRDLTEAALLAGADTVELNLGCPNVWDGGQQKSIVSFSAAATRMVLEAVRPLAGNGRVGAKLSPILDSVLMAAVDKEIAEAGLSFVTCINTVPNCFAYDDSGASAITFGSGLAGMSGAASKWIGLGQVRAHRQHLPDMPIVGVGGISTGKDVAQYLTHVVGASACQIGTAFLKRGPRVIVDVLQEYVEVLAAA